MNSIIRFLIAFVIALGLVTVALPTTNAAPPNEAIDSVFSQRLAQLETDLGRKASLVEKTKLRSNVRKAALNLQKKKLATQKQSADELITTWNRQIEKMNKNVGKTQSELGQVNKKIDNLFVKTQARAGARNAINEARPGILGNRPTKFAKFMDAFKKFLKIAPKAV